MKVDEFKNSDLYWNWMEEWVYMLDRSSRHVRRGIYILNGEKEVGVKWTSRVSYASCYGWNGDFT